MKNSIHQGVSLPHKSSPCIMLRASNSSTTERNITDFLQLAGGSNMAAAPRIKFLHKAGVKKADRTSSFLQLFNASMTCQHVCWHLGLFYLLLIQPHFECQGAGSENVFVLFPIWFKHFAYFQCKTLNNRLYRYCSTDYKAVLQK